MKPVGHVGRSSTEGAGENTEILGLPLDPCALGGDFEFHLILDNCSSGHPSEITSTFLRLS